MSVKQGGSNIGVGIQAYEGTYTLDFHKGFMLTREQFDLVTSFLHEHKLDELHQWLCKEFPEDAPIASSIIEHQKQLVAKGYYDKKG